MKYCPNDGCVAYGRVVYSQSTRCVFCRWDLKPPRMKSEMAQDKASASVPDPVIESAPAPANSPERNKRLPNFLRPTA